MDDKPLDLPVDLYSSCHGLEFCEVTKRMTLQIQVAAASFISLSSALGMVVR